MKMWRAKHDFLGGKRERKKKNVNDSSEVQ
jgi:hypothetical protein